MSSLPVIYDGIREPVTDLVAVPGLPDLFPEYKLKDHSTWLREILSHQIPGARIMSYHYDFGQASSGLTWKSLSDLFVNLLIDLVRRRESVNEARRPIVFVAYGLGALILKKALLEASQLLEFRQIFDNTVGIIFLAALHNEESAHFENSWLRCAVVELRAMGKEKSMVESLQRSGDWNVVTQTLQDFRALKLSFSVKSFFELNPTVYHSARWKGTKSAHLCPKELASLGWDSEELIGIELDHGRLSTFPSRPDPFYEVLARTIANMVLGTSPPSSMPVTLSFGSRWSTAGLEHELGDFESNCSSWNVHQDQQTQASDTLIDSLPQLSLMQARLPCFVTTPYQENPEFVGRKTLLAQMHIALSQNQDQSLDQKTFAICGLGGMGKTQVTIQYVFKHKDDFRVILWAHADSLAKLAESFSRFTVELGLRAEMSSDQSSNQELLHSWLRNTRESWLLVFDNADSVDKEVLLQEYWPATDRGSILITSRDKSLVKQFGGVELKELDEESATDLLFSLTRSNLAEQSTNILEGCSQAESVSDRQSETQNHDRGSFPRGDFKKEEEAAKVIVKRIGYLPLGIKYAANLIVQDVCSLSSFLEAYDNSELIKDSEEVRLAREEKQKYGYSLRTVWNMNFDRLSSEAQNLMNVAAFLDPDRVQMRLFSHWSSGPPDPRLQFISTPNKLHKCKTALIRSSLITQNEELREISMHRLVQASCHLRMTKKQREQNFGIAVSLVKRAWPVPPRDAVHNPSLWPEQQVLLPHVQSLCQYYVSSCVKGEPLIAAEEKNWELAKLLYEGGWFCYERGLLDLVADILLPAEQYCLKHIENGHQEGDLILADIYGGLGSLCTETNQFQGAYDNFSNQWKYLQKAFESGTLQKPSIYEVFGLGRLANGLLGLHRYTEAEIYYRKCLEAWEQVPGDRKIFTTHLATCLWLQGRLAEAEETVTRIIKDRNDMTNFRTGQALFALGNIEIAQAEALVHEGKEKEAAMKYQNAYDTHAQALRLYNVTLGPRHHKTADAYHKMGCHMHRRHEYASAKTMLNQAMSIYKDHNTLFKNEIARTTYKLGCLYQDTGELAKGRVEIERAEKMRQALTPPEKWEPATSEVAYDDIVMYWTR